MLCSTSISTLMHHELWNSKNIQVQSCVRSTKYMSSTVHRHPLMQGLDRSALYEQDFNYTRLYLCTITAVLHNDNWVVALQSPKRVVEVPLYHQSPGYLSTFLLNLSSTMSKSFKSSASTKYSPLVCASYLYDNRLARSYALAYYQRRNSTHPRSSVNYRPSLANCLRILFI